MVMGGSEHYGEENGIPDGGIGAGCRIRRAIIDLDARIGDGCRLTNEANIDHADAEQYCIRDGIIVVPRAAVLEPGTVI